MLPERGSWHKILLLATLTFCAAAALFLSGTLQPFELKAFDQLSRSLNPETTANDIVIVQIDQQSIDTLGKESIFWPWPRQIYAPLFAYLAHADAVYVDILFTEASSYGQEDDRIMAEALREAGNVYLPFFATANKPALLPEELTFLQRFTLPAAASPHPSYPAAVLPLDVFRPQLAGSGNVMVKPDADGVYRRIPLMTNIAGMTLPAFALGYLQHGGGLAARSNGLTLAGETLPLIEGSLLLRYCRSERAFPLISATDLLSAAVPGRAKPEQVASREYFRGKKVIIGLTAAGLYDLKPTSISPIASGAHIHATLLENLLHRNFIRTVGNAWQLLLMFAAVFSVTWFVLTHHSFAANSAFLAWAALCTVGIPILSFRSGLYLQVVPQVAALVAAALAAAAFSYATEGRQRRFVRRVFAQYMDEAIVSHLLENPELIKPGGRRRHVTVFFADIAGFTSLAERLSPEETSSMLHTVLNSFSEVIIRHQGVIDKYIGDCIMAFWGAPLARDEDEFNACSAAVSCLEALAKINADFSARGFEEISIRIGIHSGDAIVGNLGSDRLFDFTVIGDTVNLASRLESANKFFHSRSMVSEDCLTRTGGAFLARELGLIAVKGKSAPVRIYELLGRNASATEEQLLFVAGFKDALALFYQGAWEKSAAAFAALQTRFPGDATIAHYLQWLEKLRGNGPLTDDWNVIKMTEK